MKLNGPKIHKVHGPGAQTEWSSDMKVDGRKG